MLRMNCSSMFRSSPAIRAKSSRAKFTLAKAIDYMLKRWDGFARFLDDERICLTNNAAERALRPLCLGRRSCVNGGVKMYRRGGVKMYCGLGGSLSP